METIESMRKQVGRLQDKIDVIEKAERKKKMNELIGKCFKLSNNYSCPEKKSDYWWLYVMPLRVNSEGWLDVLSFEIDKYGEIRIRPKEQVYYAHYFDAYTRITKGQFYRAWVKITEAIEAISPA